MGSGTGAKYTKVLGPLYTTIGAKLATYHMGDATQQEKWQQTAKKMVVSNKDKFEVNKESCISFAWRA